VPLEHAKDGSRPLERLVDLLGTAMSLSDGRQRGTAQCLSSLTLSIWMLREMAILLFDSIGTVLLLSENMVCVYVPTLSSLCDGSVRMTTGRRSEGKAVRLRGAGLDDAVTRDALLWFRPSDDAAEVHAVTLLERDGDVLDIYFAPLAARTPPKRRRRRRHRPSSPATSTACRPTS
jgi:hypothetical protein